MVILENLFKYYGINKQMDDLILFDNDDSSKPLLNKKRIENKPKNKKQKFNNNKNKKNNDNTLFKCSRILLGLCFSLMENTSLVKTPRRQYNQPQHRCPSWYQTVLQKEKEYVSLEQHIKLIRQNANLNIQ